MDICCVSFFTSLQKKSIHYTGRHVCAPLNVPNIPVKCNPKITKLENVSHAEDMRQSREVCLQSSKHLLQTTALVNTVNTFIHSYMIIHLLEQHQTWSPHHHHHHHIYSATAVNQNRKTALWQNLYKAIHQTLHLASKTPACIFL